ncbi:MAG: hypothetical protein IJX17_05580 [Clostridia bacterium]|nr:hypothetical protein [Clostridia bacterium]
MVKTKSLKKALIASCLSLVMCLSMLVGTTFAWFTDSVTNNVNQIVSGNLDVELHHTKNYSEDATDMEVVDETTALYDELLWTDWSVNPRPTLWQPDVESFEEFHIENKGTLPLKYKFSINFTNATTTTAGKTLADILIVDAISVNHDSYMDEIGTFEGASNLKNFILEGTLEPGEVYKFVTGIAWTQSANDNDYNVAGGLKIDLGVTLVATQLNDAAEFQNIVSSSSELANALANGEDVTLGKNLEISEEFEIPAGTSAKLDLNGKDLTAVEYVNNSGTQTINNVIVNYGELTITGTGTIRTRNLMNKPGAKLIIDGDINIIGGSPTPTGGGSAIWNEGECEINGATITQTNLWNYAVQNVNSDSTLVINDANVSAPHGAISNKGTAVINGGTFECAASGHTVYAYGTGTLTINGGTFKHSQLEAPAEGNVIISPTTTATVIINGGTFDSVAGAFAYTNRNITINAGSFLNKATKVYQQTTVNGIVEFVPTTSTVTTNADGSMTVTKN